MKFEGKSQRLRERLPLSLPVRVRCRETLDQAWTEVTRLEDVTPFGARFTLGHPTEPGRLLHLTLPMPRQLRCFDHVEDQYRVWSLVRRVRTLPQSGTANSSASAPRFEVGVAFIGKRPPGSYESDPTLRYQVVSPAESGMWEIREEPKRSTVGARSDDTRLNMPTEVIVETFDAEGQVAAREETVTENISRRGAAVFTGLHVERGSFVRLTNARYQISVLAAVRACRTGPDGITRLHLEFVDRKWPLEGVE